MSRSSSHVYDPSSYSTGEDVHHLEAQRRLQLVFDRESLRMIDRESTQRYGIPGMVLMENAARGLADEAMKMLRTLGDANPCVLIFCGSGNNGGDGYAAARHLHNRGVDVALVKIGAPGVGTDAAVNDEICRRMGLRRLQMQDLNSFARHATVNLVIDAILGTGLDREVSGQTAQAIEWINASVHPVLAADIPSGLHCDTGEILGIAVKATRTATFVGWKLGFSSLDAQKHLGDVVVKGIGAPRELVEGLGKSMDAPHPPEPPEHEPLEPTHARHRGK